ncbi:hypothetical protein ACHWQZ_G000702 [Mnemiopsis leidyi]
MRIKQKLRQATCTAATPVLESPKCEPDPSCCPEFEERNPFIEKLGNITWPKTANGKKHELKIGNMTITRRCYYSEWDLVRYKDVETNTLALEWKINGTDEICGKTLPGIDFIYSTESDSNEADSSVCAVPTIQDGAVTPTSPITPGASFTVECSAGFTLSGDPTVGCSEVEGQVTLSQLPSCVQEKRRRRETDPNSSADNSNTDSSESGSADNSNTDSSESGSADNSNSESSESGSADNSNTELSESGSADNSNTESSESGSADNSNTESDSSPEGGTENSEENDVTTCVPTSSAPETLLGLDDENCTVLEKMLSVNLSVVQTVEVLDRLHNYTFNITDKAERTTCYNAFRYILLDPWNFGYRANLDSVAKNRLIATAANIINSWVSTVSDNLKRAFSYAAIKVKTNAAAQTSSGHIYDGWLIQMSANRYVQNSFIWSMQGLLFPLPPQSDVISPITWVDLPNNSTIPGETQYIEVNFTSSRPLNKKRHYACGVFHLGDWQNDKLTLAERQVWTRGSCDNFTTQFDRQSVICRCSSWKMFLAITETRNFTDGLFGNFIVGDASTPTMLYANQTLDVVAMVTLAAVFVLIVKSSTRRQPFMQCRMQICFAMVGSHLLSLLTSYMTPANISCVYMVYIFEIFVLATIVWFSMEFICLRNVIKGMDDPDLKPSKKYAFKMIPVVYVAAFIVPSVFITYYKHASADGALTFVQSFDAQTCWFNQDLELILFTAPVFGFILLGMIMYLLPVVTCFLSKRNCGIDVVSSGIMFLNVIACWSLNAFRSDLYIQTCSRALFAAQGFIGFMCYVWLTPDVKTSLFPGCFPTGDDDDKQKLVGHG